MALAATLALAGVSEKELPPGIETEPLAFRLAASLELAMTITAFFFSAACFAFELSFRLGAVVSGGGSRPHYRAGRSRD